MGIRPRISSPAKPRTPPSSDSEAVSPVQFRTREELEAYASYQSPQAHTEAGTVRGTGDRKIVPGTIEVDDSPDKVVTPRARRALVRNALSSGAGSSSTDAAPSVTQPPAEDEPAGTGRGDATDGVGRLPTNEALGVGARFSGSASCVWGAQ